MNKNSHFFVFIMGCIVGYSITIYVVGNVCLNKSIEFGCGQYNQTTGEFEWINKNTSEKTNQ